MTPVNDVHLSQTNRHTKVYNRVFRWRSSTERRWAVVWHWELPKKKQVGSLYKRIVYSVGIPNDSHLLVLILHFTKTGVLWLWSYWRCLLVRAFENYTNGHSTGTGMGVQQVQARAYRMNGNRRSYGHSAETLSWHVPYLSVHLHFMYIHLFLPQCTIPCASSVLSLSLIWSF